MDGGHVELERRAAEICRDSLFAVVPSTPSSTDENGLVVEVGGGASDDGSPAAAEICGEGLFSDDRSSSRASTPTSEGTDKELCGDGLFTDASTPTEVGGGSDDLCGDRLFADSEPSTPVSSVSQTSESEVPYTSRAHRSNHGTNHLSPLRISIRFRSWTSSQMLLVRWRPSSVSRRRQTAQEPNASR